MADVPGSRSGWGASEEPSVYGAYPNYLAPHPTNRGQPFNAWTVALLAYLLGSAVAVGLALVLGFVGAVLAFAIGFSGMGELTGDLALVAIAVGTVGLALLTGLAVQVRFIRRRGGARPVIATLAAVAAGWAVGLFGGLIALPAVPLVVLAVVVQIVSLAKVIQPRSYREARVSSA